MNASVSVTQRCAEIAGQRGVVALRRVRKAVEQPVHALEHCARTDKARTREQRRAQARLRCPAGMQPLGPGAFGQIFDDAAGHAAGNAERIDDLLRVEAERGADAGRSAHRAKDRCRVKARFVHGLGHHEAETAQHFGADGNADQRHAAIGIVPLAGRKHRRHDHRAGMDRPAFKGVVEILAMRRGAVDKGGACSGQRALVPDRGAGSVIVAALLRARDVILVARGDAEPDHVDQQILAFARGDGGKRARPQRDDLLRQRLRDGNLRQS